MNVANGIDHLEAFTGSLGGPILRDKLWWILSARHQSTETTVANVPKFVTAADGTQYKATNDLYVRSLSTRLTWQAAEKYKVAGFLERWWHKKGHSIGAGVDPRAGEQRDPRNAHHAIGNMKLTAPVTSKWLVEAGWSFAEFYWRGGSPSGTPAGTAHDFPFTPEWYATAPTTDTALNRNFPDKCIYALLPAPNGCTGWNATREQRQESVHNEAKFMASYVTGSHNLKFGIENDWGPGRQRKNTRNGHLQQRYVNNQPTTVEVFNNPVIQPAYVAYDVGIFVQDSWTLKRLTINPGIRVQWVETGMYESSMAAGRFAPARFIEEERGLIDFGADYSPRFSAVYDLFGDGRTALKGSWSKYYRNYDGDIAANAYGRAGERSEMRTWLDRNLVTGSNNPSGAAGLCPGIKVLPTDCDGVAQDNEIGLSPSNGAFASPNRPDRQPLNLERQYNDEFTAGVQHQVNQRLAIGAMFYKRKIADLAFQDRLNIAETDYTRFETPMPDVSRDPDVAAVLKAGEMVPVYNLNQAKLGVFNVGVVDRSDTTNDTLYTGFEASFNVRLPGGAMLFGSWTAEHTLQRWCDNNDDPNGPTTTGQFNPTAATTGVDAPLGGRYCDQTQFDYPFIQEVKFAGNYSFPYSIDVGAVMQSYGGQERVITWAPEQARFPNNQRTQAQTFILSPPGSVFYDRWNQLDINVKKNIRHNNNVLTFQIDIFNVLNANAIRAANNSVGASLGNATTIMTGRFPRLAVNYKF